MNAFARTAPRIALWAWLGGLAAIAPSGAGAQMSAQSSGAQSSAQLPQQPSAPPPARPVAPPVRCWPAWSDAAPIVRREALAGVRAIHDEVRRRFAGQLVKITLCEAQGHYVYRLVILEARGGVRNLDVDARLPFERPVQR